MEPAHRQHHSGRRQHRRPLHPYQDSVATSRDLARARLLTVHGYGHTVGNNPSTCAFNYMINYTITGAMPAPGTVCQQNINPFP